MADRLRGLDDWGADAQQVLVLAHLEAKRFGHAYVGADHLLLGFMAQLDQLHPQLMEALAPNRYRLAAVVRHTHGRPGRTEPASPGSTVRPSSAPADQVRGGRVAGEIPLTREARQIIEDAAGAANERHSDRVSVFHVALALLRWDGIVDRLHIARVDLSEFRVALSSLERCRDD